MNLYKKMFGNAVLSIVSVGAFIMAGCTSTPPLPPVVGLWAVDSVGVGNQAMTPVARWFEFTADGRSFGGNGWGRNSSGMWSFDEEGRLSSIDDVFGADGYDPFTIEMGAPGTMIWRRTEDGNPVTVFLHKIEKMPKAPWDELVGVWMLDKATESGKDATATYDPDDNRRMFMRWDKQYRSFNDGGRRRSGIWYMNAHRPELRLFSDDGPEHNSMWMVDFPSKGLMTWTGSAKNGDELVFEFSRGN